MRDSNKGIENPQAEGSEKKLTAEENYQINIHNILISIIKDDKGKASVQNIRILLNILYDNIKDKHRGAKSEVHDYDDIEKQLKQILDTELSEVRKKKDLESKKVVLNSMVTKMNEVLEENMYPGSAKISKDINDELNEKIAGKTGLPKAVDVDVSDLSTKADEVEIDVSDLSAKADEVEIDVSDV